MKKVIFLNTVHHTGTWFMIEFFNQHPDIDEWIEMKEFFKMDRYIKDTFMIHNHVFRWNHKIYKDHLSPLKHYSPLVNEIFIKSFKTVMTVRDPLRSFLTRQKREPEKTHEFIVDEFIEMIRLAKFRNVIIVPVDLCAEETERERFRVLSNVCDHCELSKPNDYIIQYASSWQKQNTWNDPQGLDKMYDNRDIDGIKSIIPDEYRILCENEQVIRPFLELYGYRDLIWFS